MPKDYKHRIVANRETSPTPGWVWLLAGLSIGLFVALLVYLDAHKKSPNRTASSDSSVAAQNTAFRRNGSEQDVTTKPKPRFDFYTLLPELEVVVPDRQHSAETSKPAAASIKPDKRDTYILQAGSFKKYSEADSMKASLALLGVESGIQKVTVNDDSWHRVRIGPYRDLAALNSVRARLRASKIDTLLLKVQD